ncbi:hypothetical protein FSP39_024222 [Pinctada imbricata]|uniref:nicotinamidase n=1 Tax=Pinctada imbricata TaxID=66713 RepID=A0AA88XUZ6_PINIB|nr:hypothetical protein FSP39_024222 [Pinctada imbricata]
MQDAFVQSRAWSYLHVVLVLFSFRFFPIWLSLLADITSASNIAFLIIDVQNCFLSGGSLAVNEGDDVIPIINDIRCKYETQFSLVVLSQDWHCSDHISFASQHPGSSPLQVIQLYYGQNKTLCQLEAACDVKYSVNQTLWPDHCVINTTSANFGGNLTRKTSDRVIRKGYNCKVDSYSAFFDNGGFEHTELHSLLQSSGIEVVFVAGLASDYCVYYTSVDAVNLGKFVKWIITYHKCNVNDYAYMAIYAFT